ncbi:MAG: response regulator [Sphingobacterium thalpophilum]|jgi:DNA-binding NarL/FixJ family response regulator
MSSVPIVILDDHKIFTESLSYYFEMKGYHVIKTFDNKDDFFTYVNESKDFHFILILDIQLKESDGYEVLQFFKNKTARPIIVILSMFSHSYIIERALREGADYYLIKDEDSEELINLLQHLNSSNVKQRHHLQSKNKEKQEKPFFSKREIEILKLLAKGHTTKEISFMLYISFNTVQTHRKNLLRKSKCQNTIELIRFVEKNLIHTLI